MATGAEKFEGCPVIVYDGAGGYITKATVREHDRAGMSVTISDPLENISQETRLKVLVVHSGGASEFEGTAKRVFGGARGIALFRERKREARGSTRYELNSPAVVTALSPDGQTPPDSVNAVALDISPTGVLLEIPEGLFEIGAALEVGVNIGGTDAVLYCKIIRTSDIGAKTARYGCKFIFRE